MERSNPRWRMLAVGVLGPPALANVCYTTSPMPTYEEHTRMLRKLKKLEDHNGKLISDLEKAMEANDQETARKLFLELQALQKTVCEVIDQAEEYRDMLISKRKRRQEREQLKKAAN